MTTETEHRSRKLAPDQRRQLNREAWALINAKRLKGAAERIAAYDRERQRLYALVLAGCDPALNQGAAE